MHREHQAVHRCVRSLKCRQLAYAQAYTQAYAQVSVPASASDRALLVSVLLVLYHSRFMKDSTSMFRNLIFFLLIFSSTGIAVAQESSVIKAAADETQAAEQELKELEQIVGEQAGDQVDDHTGDHTGDQADDLPVDVDTDSPVTGKSGSTGETAEDTASSKPWLPAAKAFDWIQLTSGEWLKGEIKSMYNDSLEFDSDKLDLLSIDWEDVKYLKSYRPSNVNIEHHEPMTGSLQISDDMVTIADDVGVREFDRRRLISLTPYGGSELELWAVKMTLALNIKQGNTEQVDYTAKLNVRRRTAKTRFVLDYIGNISKTGDSKRQLTETVNNHRINASHSVYASRYFFYQPVFAEYYRDPFQNIDQRISMGAGLGYTIFDTGRSEWRVNGGPAYVSTKFISVQPGEDQKVSGPALVLSTDFDVELTSKLDFIFKYNIQAAESQAGGYTHHMIATFESEITGRLDVDMSLIWDRISQPTRDDQGITPKPDDYRLAVGVTYTY